MVPGLNYAFIYDFQVTSYISVAVIKAFWFFFLLYRGRLEDYCSHWGFWNSWHNSNSIPLCLWRTQSFWSYYFGIWETPAV